MGPRGGRLLISEASRVSAFTSFMFIPPSPPSLHEINPAGNRSRTPSTPPCSLSARSPSRRSKRFGNLLPYNQRQRRSCNAMYHTPYPVSAAHTSIFRMDSNSSLILCGGRTAEGVADARFAGSPTPPAPQTRISRARPPGRLRPFCLDSMKPPLILPDLGFGFRGFTFRAPPQGKRAPRVDP